LAHDCVRGTASFKTRLDNNGQTSILARDGHDVNDPERTSAIPAQRPSEIIRVAWEIAGEL